MKFSEALSIKIPDWHDQGVHDLTHEVLSSHMEYVPSGSGGAQRTFYSGPADHTAVRKDIEAIGWHHYYGSDDRHTFVHPNHYLDLHLMKSPDGQRRMATFGNRRETNIFTDDETGERHP